MVLESRSLIADPRNTRRRFSRSISNLAYHIGSSVIIIGVGGVDGIVNGDIPEEEDEDENGVDGSSVGEVVENEDVEVELVVRVRRVPPTRIARKSTAPNLVVVDDVFSSIFSLDSIS